MARSTFPTTFMAGSGASPTMETARTRSPPRRRPRSPRLRLDWRRRPRGPILTPAEAPPHCRPLPATLRVRSRSATGSFMARRATARAADVTGQTPAAARSGHRSIQAIGCGATAASRGSLRRSRTASRIPSNIRASCRHWAALRFRRGTWPRWRHMFGPSAMPESHEASHDPTPTLSLQTTARWLSSAAHGGRQITSSSRFSEWQRL